MNKCRSLVAVFKQAKQKSPRLRNVWAIFAFLCFFQEAQAVFIFSAYTPVRQITMRVGAAGATVNTVTFDVAGANVAPSPSPVIGTPDAATPATSPANGTEVKLTAGLTNNAVQTIQLSVNSSAGMSCVAGGCGSTVIPFNTVSWTAYNTGSLQIQDGTFAGTATQLLAAFTSNASVAMSNVLVYKYNNATIYPAGQYQGRVTYTATIL